MTRLRACSQTDSSAPSPLTDAIDCEETTNARHTRVGEAANKKKILRLSMWAHERYAAKIITVEQRADAADQRSRRRKESKK